MAGRRLLSTTAFYGSNSLDVTLDFKTTKPSSVFYADPGFMKTAECGKDDSVTIDVC